MFFSLFRLAWGPAPDKWASGHKSNSVLVLEGSLSVPNGHDFCQELQAYAKDASRRAERCDALEAEMAEMKERLQRELLRRSEEISLEQKLQSAQKAAEERAEKAILRSEFAEQRAIAAEKKIADLEMQMAATTTDLTNSAIALQVAEAAKNRCIEEATIEKAKVAEIMERLSESEAEKSSLQKQAETSLELRNQLANAAQQQKELATKAKQDEKRCKDLMQQIARLETHISHSDELEKTRQAEVECLKEKEIELQNDLKQSQKEIGDVSAAMCAAEQRVAPLEMEASRCREEANEATREARQRRLEAEATRMAHYEQETHRDISKNRVSWCFETTMNLTHWTLWIKVLDYVTTCFFKFLLLQESKGKSANLGWMWGQRGATLARASRGAGRRVEATSDSSGQVLKCLNEFRIQFGSLKELKGLVEGVG